MYTIGYRKVTRYEEGTCVIIFPLNLDMGVSGLGTSTDLFPASKFLGNPGTNDLFFYHQLN